MNALWWLSHLAWIGGFLLATLLLAHIIRQRRPPSSTLAWILFITMAPYLGVPFYLVFGGRKVKHLARRKANLHREAGRLPDENLAPLEQLLMAQGVRPATGGNTLSLCETGQASYDALVVLIEGAKRRIDLCFFIFHPDTVGQDILNRLIRRAREGVAVHLLLDGVGSLHTRDHFLKPLVQAGGHFAFFNPVLHRPLRGHTNLRNHRKLAVFDDQKVLAGGANIAGEYMGPESRPDRWRDLTFVIEGPAVAHFVELFRADWLYASGRTPGQPFVPAVVADAVPGDVRLQVVPSGPDMPGDALYDVLLTAIFGARQRIDLVTPYFIPDDALCRAIILAVHRGVDVRILLPRRSNHRLADAAGRSYLREIQQEGGRVLLYTQGMVHAKAVVVDDELAIVGSANTDMRSLLLNYEVGVLITSPAQVAQISDWLETLVQGCEEGVETVGIIGDMGEGLARLLAPQL